MQNEQVGLVNTVFLCLLVLRDSWSGDIAITTLSGRQVAANNSLATPGGRLMNDNLSACAQ